MMNYYIAIFVESELGEWRAVFPDIPGCEARGFSLEDAKYAAASTLQQCIRRSGSPAPAPMDMNAVQRSEAWLTHNQLDLSRAVVSMIPLAA
ncbi:MAG TPA: type II toxin-antitoxin system HicB family antitoxin [Dongiaceae bacterium]|jgi:predicted RNase H-like HicB family nuclease|nr:type II toxin-antitoxin system HicB family antitoxin [Dongiaceae bacterium]